MQKTVLVSLDLGETGLAAARYGLQLAARTKSALLLMAVVPGVGGGGPKEGELILEGLSEEQRSRLDGMIELSRSAGVTTSTYLSRGLFFDEIIRLVTSQPWIQFIVLGVTHVAGKTGYAGFSSNLENLRGAFEGEILIVQEKGNVRRYSESTIQ